MAQQKQTGPIPPTNPLSMALENVRPLMSKFPKQPAGPPQSQWLPPKQQNQQNQGYVSPYSQMQNIFPGAAIMDPYHPNPYGAGQANG